MSFNRVLITTFFAFIAIEACAENSTIIKQVNSPLLIASYSANYRPSSRGMDTIGHNVTVENVSGKQVDAYQISLVSFDAFNGFLGKVNGWAVDSLQAGTRKSNDWEHKPYLAFTFERYGTGVAYVNAVRFSDGSIWRADQKFILQELQKFERELKADDLKEKAK